MTKKNFFWAISILLIIITVEIFSTLILFWHYRNQSSVLSNLKYGATSLFIVKIYERLSPTLVKEKFQNVVSEPSPLLIPNAIHGYSMKPGNYKVSFRKVADGKIEQYKSKVTINDNGYRFVGTSSQPIVRNVYIFGDSHVYGEGVNDEQTFTFLLQQEFKNFKFHLLATPGWSLANALVNIENLKELIQPNDIIILGYGDYFKQRHVASPSRMREWGKPNFSTDSSQLKHLKISIHNKILKVDQIPLFCIYNGDYCNAKEPTDLEMNEVTVAIINSISNNVNSHVVLFNFYGTSNDYVFKELDSKVIILSALKEDFDYTFTDNILGFDSHPGPFWHYAMYSRLSDFLIGFRNP